MARGADLLVRIGADISDFQNKMKGLQGSLKGIGDGLQKAGKTMTKTFTAPIVAASAAIAGITLKKGFDRLTAIDTAQAKLSALGHNAESVDKIMESALASVKGTSYGLGDAATAAASAVAAGIKPGKELTQYLTNIVDTAAIAGVEFADMGAIFNKIQTGGKATRMELNQLADRGIPIFQWLAEEIGVSGDALDKMVSEGKISAEVFNKAIEKNIGGAAKIMGEKSFVAGMQNMWAAVGRLGASFLDAGGKGGGFFSVMKDNIPKVIDFLDGLAGGAEAAGVKFGNFVMNVIEKIQQLKQWFDGLSPSTQALITKIMLFGTIALAAIGPILTIVGKVINIVSRMMGVWSAVAGAVKIVGVAIAGISAPVWAVIAVIAAMVALIIIYWDEVKAITIAVFNYVKDFIMQVWGNILSWWDANGAQILATAQNIWNGIMDVVMTVVDAVVSFVMEVWGMLTSFWAEHGEMIKEAASNVWNFISTVITTVATVVWNVIQVMADIIWGIMQFLWPFVKMLIVSTWEAIKGAITGAINVILGIIQFFSALFTGNWSEMWEAVKRILSGVVQFIWNYIQIAFVGRILKAGMTLMKTLGTTIKSGWETIRIIFMYAMDFVKSLISRGFGAAKTTVTTIMNAIRTVINTVWNVIKTVITTVLNGIKSVITTIWNAVKSVITTVLNAIKSVVTSVWNSIRSVITTVVNGIRSVITSVWNAIKSVITSVTNSIRSTISSVWNAIKSVISSVTNSIKSTISNIFNSLKGIVSGAMSGVKSAISSGIKGALNVITGMAGSFLKAGRNIVESIAKGITGAIGKVTGAIKNVAQKVRNFLPFSPPKEGPLMDIMDVKWGATIGAGLDDAIPTVQAKMNALMAMPDIDHDVDFNTDSRVFTDNRPDQDNNEVIVRFDPLDGRPIYLVSPDGRQLAEFVAEPVTDIQDRARFRKTKKPRG